MTDRSIRLIPFGGLGEFGMNCLAIACGNGSDPDTGDIVVVAGVSFLRDGQKVTLLSPAAEAKP